MDELKIRLQDIKTTLPGALLFITAFARVFGYEIVLTEKEISDLIMGAAGILLVLYK